MAEAAGLVLGGIALASLISTCVEIAEYLENAKNRAGDFRLALTKVNLIKQRLRAWAVTLPVDMPCNPQSNHTTQTTDCGDKKRFDSVIGQLEFLLSNLEKISETLPGKREMAHNNNSGRSEYSNWNNGQRQQSGHQSAQTTDRRSMVVDRIPTQGFLITPLSQSPGQPLQLHPSHNQTGPSTRSTVAHYNQAQADSTGSPSTRQGPVQGRGGRPAKGKSVAHRFEENTAHEHSEHLLGDLGVIPESNHPGHDFKKNQSRDESMMLEGSINLGEVAQLLKDKRADRRKDKADERKAAATRSRGGINKRARGPEE